jgi:hypothetical protein
MKFIVLSGLLALAASSPVPQLSHEAAVAAITQSQHDLAQPLYAQVPGLAAHFAAENALLALQGRLPGETLHNAAVARHLQAEATLIALQEQQAQFAGATGATGVVGPSGLVGPSGNIGPSGLCGPSGCIAF